MDLTPKNKNLDSNGIKINHEVGNTTIKPLAKEDYIKMISANEKEANLKIKNENEIIASSFDNQSRETQQVKPDKTEKSK